MLFCIQKGTLELICEDILSKIRRYRSIERDRAIKELLSLHEKKFNLVLWPFKLKLSHKISLENAVKITNGILPEEFDNNKDRKILCDPFKSKRIWHGYKTFCYWERYEGKIVEILNKIRSTNISDKIFIDSDDEIYKIAEEFKVEI